MKKHCYKDFLKLDLILPKEYMLYFDIDENNEVTDWRLVSYGDYVCMDSGRNTFEELKKFVKKRKRYKISGCITVAMLIIYLILLLSILTLKTFMSPRFDNFLSYFYYGVVIEYLINISIIGVFVKIDSIHLDNIHKDVLDGILWKQKQRMKSNE